MAFSAAFLLVLLGGSTLTFVVKGGTVAVLAQAEARPGRSNGRRSAFRRCGDANVIDIEPFLDGCRRLWRPLRQARRAACCSSTRSRRSAYLGLIVGGYALAGNPGILLGWTIVAVRRRAR